MFYGSSNRKAQSWVIVTGYQPENANARDSFGYQPKSDEFRIIGRRVTFYGSSNWKAMFYGSSNRKVMFYGSSNRKAQSWVIVTGYQLKNANACDSLDISRRVMSFGSSAEEWCFTDHQTKKRCFTDHQIGKWCFTNHQTGKWCFTDHQTGKGVFASDSYWISAGKHNCRW